MLEVQSNTMCPSPEEVETLRYPYLAKDKGYSKTRLLLDDMAVMVGRGQVRTLPVCHPALYEQVKEVTRDWTFDELHSCASSHRRQCPVPLKDLRDELNKPEYEALRYVLLRLATECPTDTAARRVLQSIGGTGVPTIAYQDADSSVNPADIFDMANFEELWFISPELSNLFNMRESSEISRASRHLSQTHGHYIVRREATSKDYLHVSRRYTYMYRPASFEEKVRSLVLDGDYTVEDIAQECDFSTYEIQQIVDKENVPVLNPFDTTQHSGEVNFDEVEDFLQDRFDRVQTSSYSWDYQAPSTTEITACEFGSPYYTPRTPQTPQYPSTPVYPSYPTETVITGPLIPVRDELEIRVEAILHFALEIGQTVEIHTLVSATSSTLNQVLSALSNLDNNLLNSTIG